MGFSENEEKGFSQIVYSENYMTCALNAFSRSAIGDMKINKNTLTKMFSAFPGLGSGWEFNTSQFAKYISVFEKKLGKHKPLSAEYRLKNINVQFGKYDTDIIMTYTLAINFF